MESRTDLSKTPLADLLDVLEKFREGGAGNLTQVEQDLLDENILAGYVVFDNPEEGIDAA
jgi:hypothetical protein